jgi:replicative DNA helicase
VLDGGLRAHDLTIVCGRPGVGKTVATLQWARQAARQGREAMFVCFEHSAKQLLGRLLAVELGESARVEQLVGLESMRRDLRRFVSGEIDEPALRQCDPLLDRACDEIASYGDRIVLVRASGADTELAAVDRMVDDRLGEGGFLVVDYLQKLVEHGATTEQDRVIRLAEGLKELAMERAIAVVAIAASDQSGLTARRLRLHDTRGAVALAYEADVAIVLNEMSTAVSKVHSAYDPVRAKSFRERVVMTIEKNRGGPAPIDLEFAKDFANYRFVTRGSFVTDHLVDDVLVEE